MTKQINELAGYFDPKDWEDNIEYDGSTVQVSKILHQAKRYVKNNFPDDVERLEKAKGATLYNIFKDVPAVNLCILLHTEDKTVWEEIVSYIDNDKRKWDGRYYIVSPETLTDRWEAVMKDVNEIRANGAIEEAQPEEVKVGGTVLKQPNEATAKLLDTLLTREGISPIKEVMNAAMASAAEKAGRIQDKEMFDKEKAEFERQIKVLNTELLSRPLAIKEVVGTGEKPAGKMVMKQASDVFGMKELDFMVPTWEWDGVHPDVPEIDPDYIFRPAELTRVLYAALTNQRAYLQGHTGTGKTTLIEQAAARMNQPFMCLNFDSEITRMDLIGRDTLSTDEEGKTISKFVNGILPMAMVEPYWLCLDEIDFVRPDVAYVMQRALEGNGLRITEDGGRHVTPHEGFRMFATGNTVGQGDELGMYQGARPQSLALLDRFTVWIKVNYLEPKQREELIQRRVPGLAVAMVQTIGKYVTEHIEAFTSAKVLQPISPRGMVAVAKMALFLQTTGHKEPVKEAINAAILDRATQQDFVVFKGIVDRVVK